MALLSASGAACGGQSSSQGSGATGGASGAAGSAGSSGAAGSGPTCFDASGQLVAAAKQCAYATDCVAIASETCCGPSTVVAMSTSAPEYYGCYPPVHDCPPLGCSSQATTEDGTPLDNGEFSVACVSGRCQTTAIGSGNGPTWKCHCSTGAACCTLVNNGPPPR